MNIQALGRLAANIGFSLAGQPEAGGALSKVTILMGSSQAYDATTGQQVNTPAFTATNIDALIYTVKEAQAAMAAASPTQLSSQASAALAGPKVVVRVAMVKRSDLPEGATIEREDTIVVGGIAHSIATVEADVAKATYIVGFA